MPDEATSPVSSEEFASCAEALRFPQRILLAVSGGADSMALLALASNYVQATGKTVIARTVDHGLRLEAAEEARSVEEWCEALNIPHETLHWEGEKPSTGVQAAARRARYRLLARAAEEHDCGAILTGHSASDQAETVFMRLARGGGVDGLSGMAAETLIASGPGAPCRLLRPFLSFPRQVLRATATATGQSFFDDPYNDDQVFERVRTRALLAALGQQDLLSRPALLRSAARARAAAVRLKFSEQEVFKNSGGLFHASGAAACATATTESVHGAGLARRLVRAVSGADNAPNEADVNEALQRAVMTGKSTLNGAIIAVKDAALWFYREPAALHGRAGGAPEAGAIIIEAGERALWDRRFIIENGRSHGPISVRAVSSKSDVLASRQGLIDGAPDAALGSPEIYNGAVLLAAPAFGVSHPEIKVNSLAAERFQGEIIRF